MPPLPRIFRRFAVLVVGIVLAVTAAGCVKEPTMQLHSTSVRGLGNGGVMINITVKVRNDNGFDILVRNVRTEVTLAGRHRLPTTTFSPNIWLPADRTSLLTVPAEIPISMIPALIATVGTSPVISYQAISVADVTATRAFEIDVNDYQMSDRGSFSRLELLQATGRGL